MSQPDNLVAVFRRLATPRRQLVVLVFLGLCLLAILPRVQIGLGLFDYGRWFLDSYAILASNDAVRAGLDPYQHNPLDIFNRPHSYSHWWFALGPLGLGRKDNFLFGGICVLGFIAVALAGLRPKSSREMLWYAAVLLAPPVLLAVVRANNDLVVFALMGAGFLALRGDAPWRLGAAVAGILLATGLKFYPAVGAIGLVTVRPARRLWWCGTLAAIGLMLVAADVWRDFGRAVIPVPVGVYTFGAPLLLRDLGWNGAGAGIGAGLILGLLAVLLYRSGLGRSLVGGSDREAADATRHLVASALLLVCFLGGINYAYRWIFGIWLAPWIWMQAGAVVAGRGRAAWRAAGAILLISLYGDGILCLAINLLDGPIYPGQVTHWQLIWRLCSQPLAWLLMAFLGSGLIEATVAAGRALRTGAQSAGLRAVSISE